METALLVIANIEIGPVNEVITNADCISVTSVKIGHLTLVDDVHSLCFVLLGSREVNMCQQNEYSNPYLCMGYNSMRLSYSQYSLNFTDLITLAADPGGRAVQRVGLRALDCWDIGFESRWVHECSSLV
jgi:hypothetical protein